ncbi:MAG: hypothetical protein ABEK59_03330 [Halobacteria archaeon]
MNGVRYDKYSRTLEIDPNDGSFYQYSFFPENPML